MLSLSDSEWAVMRVLWTQDAPTLGQIRAKLTADGIVWASNTILTFLARLEKKGAVQADKSSFPGRYRAVVRLEDCQKRAFAQMREKVFGGSAVRMLSCFIEQENLTREELEELRKLLDEKMRD